MHTYTNINIILVCVYVVGTLRLSRCKSLKVQKSLGTLETLEGGQCGWERGAMGEQEGFHLPHTQAGL